MPFDWELVEIAVKNLRHQQIRSLLTLLGIVIGIAAIIALITLGNGLQTAVNEQFQKIGLDKLIVTPGSPSSVGLSGMMSDVELTSDDVEVVDNVKGIEKTTTMLVKVASIKLGSEVQYSQVYGIPLGEGYELWQEMMASSYKPEQGRDFSKSDRYAAVLGNSVAKNLFDREVSAKDRIEINNRSFKVIGVYNSVGDPTDDNSVYIPLDTMRDLFDEPDSVSMIIAKTVDGYNTSLAVESVKKELKDYRNAEDFKVQSFGDILQAAGTILDIIQGIFVGIAAISLVVGGIGIMNTMLMAVMERTREIGVMKAIGATNRTILMLFLTESAFLGALGGAVGIALGTGVAYAVSGIISLALGFELSVTISWTLVTGALIFSMGVGMLSGAYPAWRAAQLDPVEALRYE